MQKSIIYLAETGNRRAFVNEVLDTIQTKLTETASSTILIKPNVVSHELYPTTTHPDVLAAAIDFLIDGDYEIAVADGPAPDAGSASKIIANHVLQKVCNEKGIELQNIHKHGFSKVHTGSMHVEISTLALNSDLIISLPILKSHMICRMTGALKNQFGLLRNRDRILMHTGMKSLSRGIAEVNTIARPNFIIMDAVNTYKHANEKRHGGGEVGLGCMLASDDPVALDCLGLEMLKKIEPRLQGLNPDDIPYIAHAKKIGLGSYEYETRQISIPN